MAGEYFFPKGLFGRGLGGGGELDFWVGGGVLGGWFLQERRSRLKWRLEVWRRVLVGLVILVLMPLQLMFFFMSLNYRLAI